jgi:hypothetical protein
MSGMDTRGRTTDGATVREVERRSKTDLRKHSNAALAAALVRAHGWCWDAAASAVLCWRYGRVVPVRSLSVLLSRIQWAKWVFLTKEQEEEIHMAYKKVKGGA